MKHYIFILLLTLLLTGCRQKQQESAAENAPVSVPAHQWYYFTVNGIEKTDLPQNAEISTLKPWTESLRTADANSSKSGEGFLVVNRLGVVVIESGNEPKLLKDYSLFNESTASNLVFYGDDQNETPFLTLYRNSFFNSSADTEIQTEEKNKERPYLVRISVENGMFYPAVTYGDLGLSFGGEITGSFFDGDRWLSSIKTQKDNRTYFSYISWKPAGSALALSPVTKEGKIEILQSSESEYRSVNSPSPLSSAPERLRTLLSSIPEDFSFTVHSRTTGGYSARIFSSGDQADLSEASSIMDDEWICAVFSDGTTYFSGALDSRPLTNNGKTTAFRLPKLPEGYIYTDFCISGAAMAVGWEERDFFKTGRSGFILIDLEKIL